MRDIFDHLATTLTLGEAYICGGRVPMMGCIAAASGYFQWIHAIWALRSMRPAMTRLARAKRL